MIRVLNKQSGAVSFRRQKENLYTLLFLGTTILYITFLSAYMGLPHLFSTIMNTAYRLLIDTALYILAISVVMGAVAKLMAEFRIIQLLNRIFAPLMRPLYNLPGASFLGIITTYLSDNPSIIVLAHDRQFKEYFREDQIPCLCNLGTAFGMGLILTTFMIGQGFVIEPLIGNLGAVIGSIVSVRLMNGFIRRKNFITPPNPGLTAKTCPAENTAGTSRDAVLEAGTAEEESFFTQFMSAMLEGGKNGVDMGLKLIPGLLFVCTVIMTLTFGKADPAAGYQGLAYEGVAVLPFIGEKMSFVLTPLFGFTSSEAIAFPITSLGAVGAAISLVPRMLNLGLISG